MSKPAIGELITGPAKNRDAIHVPIIEAIIAEGEGFIAPGTALTLVKEGDSFIAYSNKSNPVGVVDPFINKHLRPGDRFYLWLRPDSTKKLWHDWTHKDIDK